MGKLYSTGKGDLDWCADTIEGMREGKPDGLGHGPIVGVNVQVGLARHEIADIRSQNVGKVDHAMMHLKHSPTLDHPVVQYGQRPNTTDTGTSHHRFNAKRQDANTCQDCRGWSGGYDHLFKVKAE
jgi:hypothetical protein